MKRTVALLLVAGLFAVGSVAAFTENSGRDEAHRTVAMEVISSR